MDIHFYKNMQDFVEILKKIPDKERAAIEGSTLQTVINPVLCVTERSIFEFKIDEHKCDSQLIDWLNKLDFTLKDWSEARKIIGGFTTSRNSKILAIQDVVRHFDFERIYSMNSIQLRIIPGFNKSFMKLPPIEQGVKLTKDRYQSELLKMGEQPKSNKVRKTNPVPTFKEKLVNSTNKNLATVKGSGPVKTGSVQQKLCLYLKILKGNDITKILTSIKSKKTISKIEIIEIRSTQSYSSYQLKMTVDVSNFNFWKLASFWPHGAVVKLWKGDADYEPRQLYHKRVMISNLQKSVSADTIIRTSRSIFSNIQFEKISVERIYNKKAVLALELQAVEFRKFMGGGLRHQSWPQSVKVRFLRRNSIASRGNGWIEADSVPEIARSDSGGGLELGSACEELPIPEDTNSSELLTSLGSSIGIQTELENAVETAEVGVQTGEQPLQTIVDKDVGKAEIAIQVGEQPHLKMRAYHEIQIKPISVVNVATATSCVNV